MTRPPLVGISGGDARPPARRRPAALDALEVEVYFTGTPTGSPTPVRCRCTFPFRRRSPRVTARSTRSCSPEARRRPRSLRRDRTSEIPPTGPATSRDGPAFRRPGSGAPGAGDLPRAAGAECPPRRHARAAPGGPPPGLRRRARREVRAGGVLHGVYGATCPVNSLHHQSVATPGDGVASVGTPRTASWRPWSCPAATSSGCSGIPSSWPGRIRCSRGGHRGGGGVGVGGLVRGENARR